MTRKAAMVFWHHGVRLGVAVEAETGHTVEWRFSTDAGRPPRSSAQRESVSWQERIALYAFFWERIPAISVYGAQGFDLPLGLDPPVSPRELFLMIPLPVYSPHGLWFVEPDVTVDDFYGAALSGEDDLGVAWTQAYGLMPGRGCPRPGGIRMAGQPPAAAHLLATAEMLAAGIVGYRYVEGGALKPIRSHRRFEVPTGDRARLRELLGKSLGPT